MSRPACARIDLAALTHNLSVARKSAPRSQVMAVIKADAYGHGVLQCADALKSADAFAVAGIDEALVLRAAGFEHRILLLGGIFDPAELDEAAAQNLDLVVHDAWQLAALRNWSGAKRVNTWLKVDSGMHRLGIPTTAVAGVAQELAALNCVRKVRLMTHLACADEPGSAHTSQQLAEFAACSRDFAGERSIANSAGVLAWPDAHADWIRPGIMLYGGSPFVGGNAQADGLLPVMHLESRVITVRDLAAGEAVGYGATWKTDHPIRMGVVAMGYGDGYPRQLGTGTPVLVDDQPARLIGRVSMDLITLDLTAVPAVGVGSVVRFWGAGLPADKIAGLAGTISYELLTGITARVPRVYC